VGKNVEKLVKKKEKRWLKYFGRKFWRLVCVLKKVAKYSGQPRPETNFSARPWGGGAKFISSPWAQKWLATALTMNE
jgi:hypothetical protein